MDQAIPNIPPLKVWHWIGWFSILIGVLTGGYYLYLQYSTFGTLIDPIFVGLILANTVTAFRFGIFFSLRLVELIAAFNAIEHESPDPIVVEDALKRIFENRLGLLFAVAFSTMISGPVFVMAPWAGLAPPGSAASLTVKICVFLFFANLMVGFGLYCLFRYWQLSAKRIQRVELAILNPSRPDLVLFQLMTKMVVVLAATLSCIAITSLVFSVFEPNSMTIVFSIASFTLVLATYFLPIVPLSTIFRKKKFEELHKVETLIARHYEAQVLQLANGPDIDLEALMIYRNEIRAIKTLPPGREFSIVTAGSVALITFLPVLFELSLSKLNLFTGG